MTDQQETELSGAPNWTVLRSPGFLLTALGGMVVALLAMGIPTDVVPNPWFTRMTSVRTLDVVFLVLTSLLLGPLIATYLSSTLAKSIKTSAKAGLLSGPLGWFAIGCPICNKIIVALLGVSGALNYFEPIQPLLGLLGVGLAAAALYVRLSSYGRSCALPALAP